MKKVFKVIIALIIIIIITIMCYEIYEYFVRTDKESKNEIKNDIQVENQNEIISQTAIFSLEDYPKVDASLATQPLTDEFIKNFTGEEEISEEYLDYTNTHPAYIRLIDGEADLIVVTEPSEDELEYAKEKGIELEVIPVVREAFVFYVNSENPVNGLTIEEIQNIYTGEITNWNQLGGNNEEIRAFQRPENSGSQTGMLSLVMKDKKIMEPLKEDLIESMFAIIDLVSDYDNGLNSIGYSYYYYATTMFDTIDATVADKIKLLEINGVAPNNETIKKEEYPLETAYYIVFRKDEPENSNVRKLAEAMLSDRGQKVAEEAGYVGVK